MYSVLANNGAFCFIDAIDPEGTLNRDFYVRMGELFQEMEKYEKYFRPQLKILSGCRNLP